MKVCFFVSDFEPKVGGIATFNNDLVATLAKEKEIDLIEVVVFQGSTTSTVEVSSKCTVRYFPRKNIFQIFPLILKELWRVRNFDVIHSPNVFPVGFLMVLIAKVLRIPTVITFHGTDMLERRASSLTKLAKKFTVLNASASVTVSRAVAEKVTARLSQRTGRFIVIYYSFVPKASAPQEENARTMYGVLEEDIIVLAVGNLVRRKGFDDVIRAMAFIKNPRIKLLIAGDGPEKEALQGLTERLFLLPRVQFLGRVSSVGPLYRAADIFVLASRFLPEEGDIEGLGIVLLEAAQNGLPVIGTKSGGIPEALIDGETGFLVDEGDNEALARMIEKLAQEEELRKTMGEKGKAFVADRFNPEHAAKAYISLYEGLRK